MDLAERTRWWPLRPGDLVVLFDVVDEPALVISSVVGRVRCNVHQNTTCDITVVDRGYLGGLYTICEADVTSLWRRGREVKQ